MTPRQAKALAKKHGWNLPPECPLVLCGLCYDTNKRFDDFHVLVLVDSLWIGDEIMAVMPADDDNGSHWANEPIPLTPAAEEMIAAALASK